MKRNGWLAWGGLAVLLLGGSCGIGSLLLGNINLSSGRYKEGPGPAGKATESQVVKAEFGFNLPPSASDVLLAVHGGKDIGISGRMLVDPKEIEAVLVASGYELGRQVGFSDWTDLYPKMTWFVLSDSEVARGFQHPDHQGRVVISIRRADDGRVEVFFQRWSGKRSPVTWRYLE